MNKKTKEPVYRDIHKGARWRFISEHEYAWGTSWLMARVKDGFRAHWPPNKMKLEKPA